MLGVEAIEQEKVGFGGCYLLDRGHREAGFAYNIDITAFAEEAHQSFTQQAIFGYYI
jgi:hypothetical protein